jgi:DNA polymerase (family X)
VSAYRRAADTVAGLDEDVAALLEREGPDARPGIGSVLAHAIAQMVRTGRWAQLERLRGAVAPEQLFQSIPGLGPELARRIHEHLDVDTLEGLELAAHDGRLEQVPSIGPRRAAMLRAALARMLARTRRAWRQGGLEPEVDLLLDVDREYRDKAERGVLPKIAPRRFNAPGAAWLPILHTERGDWRFTALFSNTALAHKLGRVGDWVVIYFHQDSGAEGQRTVVTETRGRLAGRRVVRGREAECLKLSDMRHMVGLRCDHEAALKLAADAMRAICHAKARTSRAKALLRDGLAQQQGAQPGRERPLRWRVNHRPARSIT